MYTKFEKIHRFTNICPSWGNLIQYLTVASKLTLQARKINTARETELALTFIWLESQQHRSNNKKVKRNILASQDIGLTLGLKMDELVQVINFNLFSDLYLVSEQILKFIGGNFTDSQFDVQRLWALYANTNLSGINIHIYIYIWHSVYTTFHNSYTAFQDWCMRKVN